MDVADAIVAGIVHTIVDSFHNVGTSVVIADKHVQYTHHAQQQHILYVSLINTGMGGNMHVTYNMFKLYKSKNGGIMVVASNQGDLLANEWLHELGKCAWRERELDLQDPGCIDELISVVADCGGIRRSPSRGRLRQKLRDIDENMLRERPARIPS